MRSVAKAGSSSEPVKKLTFTWNHRRADIPRMLLALFLTAALFCVGWLTLRLVVPISIPEDSRRLASTQIIVVGEESDPSLLRLLEANRVPSLDLGESVGDAPLVDDLLAQIGLASEPVDPLRLYPSLTVEPELEWPLDPQKDELTLPSRPNFVRAVPAQNEPSEWVVILSGEGALSEIFPEKKLPWVHPVPVARKREMLVVIDDEGATVAASLLGDRDSEVEAALRQLWEESLTPRPDSGEGKTGIVKVEFRKAES